FPKIGVILAKKSVIVKQSREWGRAANRVIWLLVFKRVKYVISE
ncbi:MAG: hypothetical protein ACD_76C00016G0004, partial [uncultured bacterium]